MNDRLNVLVSGVRDLQAKSEAQSQEYAELREMHMDKEEANYEVFQDEIDILISTLSKTHLKEISNLVKSNSLVESPGNSAGNFVNKFNIVRRERQDKVRIRP